MPGGNGFRGSVTPINLGQGRGPFHPKAFFIPYRQPARYVITGRTRDSTGAPIGAVTVYLLEQPSQLLRAISISDANGDYLVDGQIDYTYKVDFYKSGTPDLAGSTVNTVVATPA